MLSIISAILGIGSSALPNVLSFFQQKGDQKHEREMAILQNQQAMAMAEKGFVSQEKVAAIELEGTYAETYAQERVALYDHDKQLIEKASQNVVDLNAKVRPFITFMFVGLLVFVDVLSLIWVLYLTSQNPDLDFFLTAIDKVFSTEEMSILASIIGFWFGSRQWEKYNSK
jgi:hypothetical protein